MNGQIGEGMRLDSISEFNRRAAIAIRGSEASGRAQVLARKVQFGGTLSADEQQAFLSDVHRWRHELTDAMVIEYAGLNMKGYA